MNYIKCILCMLTCSLSVVAQSMSVHQGGEQLYFSLNEVDSITFDATPNLWQRGNTSLRF